MVYRTTTAILLTSLLGHVSAQEQNILRNGGFETGLMCYSTSIWSLTGNDFVGDYRFVLSPDARSGAHSLEIRCTGPDCMKAAITSDKIQTPPGQSYRISLYTKCPQGRDAALYIPGTAGGDTYKQLACNGAWALNQFNFVTGPTMTELYFYVYNRDLDWLRVDDVVLTYSDGTVPVQPVLYPGIRDSRVSGQRLEVDGKPYFALGFFEVDYDDIPAVASYGGNTLVGLGPGLNSGAHCFNTSRINYLDRAYELGLNVVPSSKTTARLAQPDIQPLVASTFARHKANIMWLLADEPDQVAVPYWYVPPESLVAQYNALKPHLAIPVTADFQRAGWSVIGDVQPYAGAVDVWMAEPYGREFGSVDYAINMFNTISRRPIWLAQDATDVDVIVPKAYWAAIGGATGIIYFNWHEFKSNPPKLASAAQAMTELKQLNDVLFAANADSQVTPPAGVRSIARSLNGSLYVLAAKPDAGLAQGKFVIPGLASGSQVQVLFENRVITAEKDGFTDIFSGVSRHVYVVPGSPVQATITATQPGLTVTVDGANCLTPCVVQWPAGSTHTVAIPQTTQTLSAGTRHIFTGWSDGGAASHSVMALSTPLVLTALFKTQHYLTTTASPAAGGALSPPSAWFDAGTAVSLQPQTNNGYQFASFSGSLSGATQPHTVAMNASAVVTANFTPIAAAPGWLDAFTHRRKITIDPARVAGSLTDFPLLISLSQPDLKSIAAGGHVATPEGRDIAFTAADGVTRWNHELERYDAATGSVLAWVRVPVLTSTANRELFIYYGKAASVDQQNQTAVWDTAYRIVNHLNHATPADSTQFANTPVPSSGAAVTAAGAIGSAYSVDGIAGQLSFPQRTSWSGAFSQYSVEFWFRPLQLPDYSAVLAIGGWSSPFNIWFTSNGNVNFRLDTTAGYCSTAAKVPLNDAFHHLAVVYDSSLGKLTAYINGVPSLPAGACSGYVAIPAGSMILGRFDAGRAVSGVIDEFRVSAGAARSADWLLTSVRNQANPAAFYSVAPLEARTAASPVTTTIASSPPGRTIVVDGNACTAPCMFQWTPGSQHTLAVASPQSATASTRFVYANWSDGAAQSHVISAPAAPASYTVAFTTQHLLTTAASPAAAGTISPPTGWFDAGATATLSAAANSGYAFSSFTGAITGTASPAALTVNAPASVTATFNPATTPPPPGWYPAWSTRRKIVVDRLQVASASPLADFPVLVTLTHSDLRPASLGGKVANSDGRDILFTAGDGTTRLNFELEAYDSAAGTVVAWVRVPALSSAADTPLYLYYGNPAASSQQNTAAVWDSNYRVVNHLTNAALADSTQYGNTAVATTGVSVLPGPAGPAHRVDGLAGQISVPYSPSWNAAFPAYTVEFWIKPEQIQDYGAALAIGDWNSSFNMWFYTNGSAAFRLDTAAGYCAAGGAVPLDNAFHHIAMTYDSARSSFDVLIDGVGRQYPSHCSGKIALPPGALTLGRFLNGRGVRAVFDEFRISATGRSAAWIVTGYRNQKSPATFYSVAAPESATATAVVATTVASTPPGLSLTVDGVNCIAPCSFQWIAGSTHSIAASSPQTLAGTQYLFTQWSDGGPLSHPVTANAPNTYTATFTPAQSAWYGIWTTRRQLTVDRFKVAGAASLTGFPMLVSITDPELKASAAGGKVARPDGGDIAFTAADGTTRLNHELESYNHSSGALVAWVQVPVLSASQNTVLYLYYGNAGAPPQQNRTAVWDSGYRIVNHLSPGFADATQYANNAASAGNVASTTGIVGSAALMDGGDAHLSIPANPSWNAPSPNYTVELWIKPGQLRDYIGALAIGSWGTPFSIWLYGNGSAVFRIDTTGGYCAAGGAIPLDNAFHHLAMTYDAARARFNVFIDGVGRPYPASCSGNVALPAGPLLLGRFQYGQTIQAAFDELRVSASPRSDGWIVTGYNNQKAPGAFYAVGPSETLP